MALPIAGTLTPAKNQIEASTWLIALVSPQKASTGRGKAAKSNPKRDRVWAEAALEEECKLIAAAPYGQRNDQLNASTFNIFQIVWGNPGLLDEEEVRQRLFAAAEESDLVEDDGADTCWRTIESAAESARAQPRTRPQLAAPQAGLNLHKASATLRGGRDTALRAAQAGCSAQSTAHCPAA